MLLMFVCSIVSVIQDDESKADAISTFRVQHQSNVRNHDLNLDNAVKVVHRLWQKAHFPDEPKTFGRANEIIHNSVGTTLLYRGRCGVGYSIGENRLYGLFVSPPRGSEKPNLTLDQCVQSVREYYKLVGGKNHLILNRAYFDPDNSAKMDEQKATVVFNFAVPGTNDRFASGIEAIVDRTYGTPDNMQIGVMPAYDRANRRVTKDQAAASAAAAVADFTGWSTMETGVQDASYRVPTFKGMPTRMADKHLRREREKRAGLMYEVTVRNALADGGPDGKSQPFTQVFVDAETGEAVAIFPAYQRTGGSVAEPKPFAWTGRWTSGKATDFVVPTTAEKPAGTRRVLLSQDRTALCAEFDPKSGYLWARDGKGFAGGKPGSKLAKELATAKPVPKLDWMKPG